jgi:acyl-CoA synthetase (AMP-forming)/AMP-acid ligase II
VIVVPDDAIPPSVPAALARAVDRFGRNEALIGGGERLTYVDLGARVERATRAVVAAGIQPGDRVAIWAPNSVEWAIASLAVHSAGAVLVPLNTRFKGAEARYILERSGARLLLTVTDFLGADYVAMLRDVGQPDALEQIVVLSGPTPDATTTWASFLDGAAATSAADAQARAAALTQDDLADIIFTSGTTGAPKGAMLRHGATTRSFTAWTDVVGLTEVDRYLVINPFFHTFGLKAGILACVLTGATIVPQPMLDVTALMERIQEERISMTAGAPTVFQSMLDHPERDRYDLSSLRRAVTGAAVVPVEMVKRLRSELTFSTVVTGYGLTESTGIVTMCRHDDDPETIANTSGRAIPGVEVRVVDDAGAPLPVGEAGEIVARGYNLMAGYLDDPVATAEAIDTDGWLHTGDVGVLDERGNLRITDRKKDMFIVGGFNAYPAEIENMILRHPSVAQVALVGVPDTRLGEVGMAFVIPRPGATVDPDMLIAWCRTEMANYKVPRYVEVVDALPLNASGKVLKFELRDRGSNLVAGRTA